MPRKGKRSQAQKLRQQKVRESQSEQAEGISSQSSPLVSQKVSYAEVVKRGHHNDGVCVGESSDGQQVNSRGQRSVSDGNVVMNAFQHDKEQQVKQSLSQMSYADMVKRGRDAAGTSPQHSVNVEPQPSVTHVCASRSQASLKYGKYRNSQCVANSLVFLSFLHENEKISRADLDLVLDKGDAVYRQARERFPNSVHLAADELPDEVSARRSKYQVDLTQLSVYGTFGGGERLLSLEHGLSFLSSDVQYGLLIMTGLCIAVFRCRSGQYGYFDPHSRNKNGMPLSPRLLNFGTAVMLKFTHLRDMIDRIKLCYTMFDIDSSCMYELKPLSFHCVNTSNQRNAVSDTGCRHTAVDTPPLLDEAVNESHTQTAADQSENISPEMSTDTNVEQVEMATFPSQNFPQNEPNLSASVVPTVPNDICCNVLEELSTDITSPASVRQEQNTVPCAQVEHEPCVEIICPPNDASHSGSNICHSDLPDNVLKGISCKLSKLSKQKKRKMKRRMMARKKPSQRKDNQKRREREMYVSNEKQREKKRSRIRMAYQENAEFREKQKSYIRRSYREKEGFSQRQKMYIINRYRQSESFRQRQRSYITQRYANDRVFRIRHRQLMKKLMRNRYRNSQSFRMMHNVRCAMSIKRKYRRMNRNTQSETETREAQSLQHETVENRLINEAISVFRSNIKAGPTYVCTVCHKASFPNQVRTCTRSNYEKNPNVVSQCLTGKYVHVCDEACRNEPCTVPDERRKEWICHTCHAHLKKGCMSTLAVANKLQLSEIPSELSDLNILERHLIAKCIPFAKIIPLPRGRQRLIRGNVVCVPSEVQETVNALPRLRSESQVMRVKLKRRLSYRGHQLFQTVTWSKLVSALLKLKQVHPEYQDVTIRDEAQLCDPTIPDDENDDDDEDSDVSMGDNDYDDADLMQIDMCERNALCEAENEPENDQNCECEQPQQQRDDGDEGDLPNGGFALESCLQPLDISEEILCYSDNTYCVAPAQRNSPLSFFRTPNLESMSFPVQFPTGENTLDQMRHIKVSPSGYFKSRLFNVDDRFARDPNYLFFAQFVIEIHLANNSMTIQLRKGRTMTRDGRTITSGMLQDKGEVERLVRNKDAVRFMQPLRGTPVYWEKTTKDLFAMIRQLGTPTFFCTFSAAEFRWPEVIEAIKRQQGEQVDFESLDWTVKCEILRSNPVTCMRLFDKRVEALFRDLLLSNAQPLGKVIDFFYRVEFQHRGSPHIHAMLWVDGAPELDVCDDQTVCDFVDRYISAQLPDPETQPELFQKVSEVQKHSKNHTRSCFKSVNSGCRFGFPKPPCTNTMITRPGEDDNTGTAKSKLRPLLQLLNEPEIASLSLEQVLSRCNLTLAEYERCLQSMNRKTAIYLKRDPKDCWINGYNPHLLKAWDSNIDVSFILNAYSCIQYLTKYITKKESGLSEYLKTVMENSNMDRVNECDEMRAVMQAYSKKREISAQECVTRACGIKMKKCSRSVVFVPTDDNPVKMSRPMSFLEDTPSESCNVWMTSFSDKYKARPETPEYEEMCSADFAATCRFVSADHSKRDGVLPLLNELGFVQRRKNDKPSVIRYYHCSKEKHPEQFYARLLRLYLPHRSEYEIRSADLPTYESFYSSGWVQLPGSNRPESVKTIVKANRHKYEKNTEEIDNALVEFEESRDHVIDEWCNLAPESEVVRLPCDDELQEREPDDEQENVPDYCPQSADVTEMRATREPPAMDPAVLRHMYQNLNQKQACVFYAIRDWCNKLVCGLNPEQFFFYVNGGAGTGKSHLIKCIYSEASKILSKLQLYSEEFDISNPTVLLSSFTGTAAFNISGLTLHSLLKLPRSLKPPIQGLGNQLDELRSELFNAQIIIIDEISMVSKPLFAYVDARLKQIKGNQRAFGGMSVLAVGDFYQLPPVRQSKPLCVHDPADIDLWQEHFQMITLTEIMRQKDDVAFAEVLNRIRVKRKADELSQADRDLLSQAITEPARCPTEVLHIFPTNKLVDEHNSATLTLFHSNIITIDADDFQKDPRTGRMARKDTPCKGGRNDLADTLKVAEGARVMLTRNFDVQNGLVNGAFATLMSVVTSEDDQHITKLGLRMDNQTGVTRNQSGAPESANLVYIERAEEKLKQNGVVRRQFPVRLAFACTVHKTQGLTTHAAVVSLQKIFEAGMAYVALSRVTSLSGLYLLDLDEKKIYANPEVTAALETMRQADVDHMMPLLQVRETVNRPDTLTLVHHNTEGLPAHIGDIKRHHELCLADVLCLTETHLQGSFVADSLQLDGYNMFKRNRHTSYTKYPQMASKGGGGVAVYVRNHIQVRERQYLHNVTDLEFVALKVEAPFCAVIAAVYRPPDYSLRPFLENLVSLLDALEVLDCHPVIVCGDFNENQLLGSTKPILELFQSKGYVQLITSATTDKNTLLDLIFISQPQRCLQSGVMRTYYSYHNPVFCVLSTSEP